MAATPFDVVAVGEINADLILSGDVMPAFGQVEKLLDEARLVIGSSTAIFACAAARLGLRTAIVGKVGSDVFGRFMVEALTERGVDTSGVVVDPEVPTGLSVILSRGADRAILTAPGAIPALRHSEISPALLRAARHLHLGSFFLLDALRPDVPRLFQEARGLGATVSIDTNFDPSGAWNGGLREAMRYGDFAGPIPLVAIKLGEDGAMAKRGEAPPISLGAPSVEVVDTVGAGDCFDAGFVYGFLNGWDPRRALQLGIACGSLSTRRAGGTDSQPRLEEAMRFIEGACPEGSVGTTGEGRPWPRDP
ncbi:MAG TPA: sugar kinase [Bauldia sp.]|nr:sugar kinase [Bauldia sp.]